jgi:hypothetical protein
VEKIALVKRRKAVERGPTCCGKFLYKLLNRGIDFSWWEVNLRKQIIVSPLWFASLVDF